MRLLHVDAFTDRPFGGNPAAVCFLDGAREPGWMQQVACEMNLSETAFVWPREDGFQLRWFTPTVEVELCGHATLAAAHALWEERRLGPDEPARFHTQSGLLTARREGAWIALDFPAKPASEIAAPAGLAAFLGAEPVWVGKSDFDFLVELASEELVRGLAPDLAALARFGERGVIVTAVGAGEVDFVSRFFAPGAGIPEDPVTGSAHCTLGPYWGARLGKAELRGYQASARGGFVGVRLAGERVILRGQAVTTVRGELV